MPEFKLKGAYNSYVVSKDYNDRIYEIYGKNVVIEGFEVEAGGGSSVAVSSGKAVIEGVLIEPSGTTPISTVLTVPANTTVAEGKIYFVCLEYTHIGVNEESSFDIKLLETEPVSLRNVIVLATVTKRYNSADVLLSDINYLAWKRLSLNDLDDKLESFKDMTILSDGEILVSGGAFEGNIDPLVESRIEAERAEIDSQLAQKVYNYPVSPPSQIETQLSDGQIILSWSNSQDIKVIDTSGKEIILAEFESVELKRDGAVIYEGASESFVDYGLANYQQYTYELTSIAVSGARSEVVTLTITLIPFAMDLPYNVTNFKLSAGNTEVTGIWTNPIEIDFVGVLVRASNVAAPASVNEGALVYNGSLETFIESGLANDTQRFYTIWAYNNNNQYSSAHITQSATPRASVVYGVKIDTTNSNPETAVTYTDMSVGFTPARGNNGVFNYGSWEDKFPFNQIKPCLYLNGAVNYYLNPSDYTKKSDGSNADITTGADGDVMVEFPKIYWKFETVGTNLFIRYSDTQFDAGYKCLAHTKGVTEKDFVYISAYLGHTLSSKLRSLSGKTPTASKTIGAFRTEAQANGAEFEQMAYYQLLMTQVLSLVMFKSRDIQTALGRGFVDGNTAAIATGGTNLKGMFYGETTGKQQLKFCGIEDWYGNLRYWIDGFFSDPSRNMLIGTESFNNTGSGYSNYGQGATGNIGGYISAIQGGTETGFVVKVAAGSSTTHYADSGALDASRLPSFGGNWTNADTAGAFRLNVYYSDSNTDAGIGARSLAL